MLVYIEERTCNQKRRPRCIESVPDIVAFLKPMVKRLPDKYQEAIQLSEIEKKTQQEVAELVNVSLSGAKSRVQRGRTLLKKMVYECCHIEVNKNKQLIGYDKKDTNYRFC